MPINDMLNDKGPEEREVLRCAFEKTLHSLHLIDRNDPVCKIVAEKVIEIGATGVRDACEISKRAIRELGVP